MQMNNQASTFAGSDSWNKTEQGITLVSSSLQTTNIVFTEDLVQKNREEKYDLCCEQIEIIYGGTVTPFVFWSFADWFQESVRIVVVFGRVKILSAIIEWVTLGDRRGRKM